MSATFTYKLGAMSIIVFDEYSITRDAEAVANIFKDVPFDALEAELKACEARDSRQLIWSMNPFLIQTGDHNILVDTGLGSINNGGAMFEGMEKYSISPDEITHVIITHCHPDHIGGLIDADGVRMFPNATCVVNRVEWEFWTGQGVIDHYGEERAKSIPKFFDPYADSMQIVEPQESIVEGVVAIATYGHTPGHMGLEISSEGETLVALVDFAHSPIQAQHPNWSVAFDVQKEISPITRRDWMQQVADKGQIVLVHHFAFPGIGQFKPKGNAFIWEGISPD